MTSSLPILYTKAGCPWCTQAREVLDSVDITYTEKEVRSDPLAFANMRNLSGQTSAPVLDWHGEVLADFGAEELRPFLTDRGYKLDS